jgi:hypothetical protein
VTQRFVFNDVHFANDQVGWIAGALNFRTGGFLNRDFTDSGIRSMWVQIKLIF